MAAFGNVAPSHTFLRAIGHQRGGVGIHGGAVERMQASEEFGPKFGRQNAVRRFAGWRDGENRSAPAAEE